MRTATALSAVLLCAGAAMGGQEIQSAPPPQFHDLWAGSFSDVVDATSDAHAEMEARFVRNAGKTAAAHPDRLITLRLVDIKLRYDELATWQRQTVKRLAGDAAEPQAFYEQTVAKLLADVMSGVDRGGKVRLSVADLPLEGAAAASNARYAPVMEQMDALVSTRSLIVSSAGSELSAARLALPQAFAMAGDRPVLFRTNGAWRMAAQNATTAAGGQDRLMIPEGLLDGPLDPTGPIAQLLEDWGESDSPWDLNGDGIVDILDLLILLDMLEQPGGPIAQWVDPPAEYTLGSAQDILLLMLEGAPADPNVVFQVWSEATQSIEAAYPDYDPPFVYPGAALDTVTPGGGEIQAVVRDGGNQVIEVIGHAVTFVAGGGGGQPTGTWSTQTPEEPFFELLGGGDDPVGGGGGGGGGGAPNTGGGWGDPTAPVPVPNIHIIDASGTAPFTAHVHALDSQIGVGDPLSALYHWDFGDSSGAFDQLPGWNAAHSYNEPGVYTITLTLMNEAGQTATTTAEVTVTENQRTELYVSADGDDVNDGLSPATAIRTYGRAVQMLTNNMVIRFRRGDEFEVSGSSPAIERDNWMFSTYGQGDRAVLRWTGGLGYGCMLGMGDQCHDAVIEGLHFDSIYANYSGRNIVDAIRPDGVNVTVRDCSFGQVTMAMNTERQPVGMMSYNNEAMTPGSLRAYYVWGQGSDHTHVGNVIASGSAYEHIIRLAVCDRVLIAYNEFTNQPKRCIWLMTGNYGYASNNTLHDGRVTVGPNHALGNPAGRFKWAVVENNVINKETPTTPGLEVEHGAEHVMLRNNVIKTSGMPSIAVKGWSSQMSRTTVDLRVYNNTGINSGVNGRFFSCGTGAVNVKVANNLYVAPNLETGANHSAIVYILDEDLEEFDIRNNAWPIPQVFHWIGDGYHYLWGNWANANGYKNVDEWAAYDQTVNEVYENITLDSDYRPGPGCAAVGHAQRVAGVYGDLAGDTRPADGVWTAGAAEAPE